MLGTEQAVGSKLSRAAVETLAIIAYHQPTTRAEIEEIRGVALSKGTLAPLLEAAWIRPRGRRETPGRPLPGGKSTDRTSAGQGKGAPIRVELGGRRVSEHIHSTHQKQQ